MAGFQTRFSQQARLRDISHRRKRGIRMDSRLEDSKEITARFTEKEVQEKTLKGLLEIYALYRDRGMLPYQGRDPHVTPHSLTIGQEIEDIREMLKEIAKEWPEDQGLTSEYLKNE